MPIEEEVSNLLRSKDALYLCLDEATKSSAGCNCPTAHVKGTSGERELGKLLLGNMATTVPTNICSELGCQDLIYVYNAELHLACPALTEHHKDNAKLHPYFAKPIHITKKSKRIKVDEDYRASSPAFLQYFLLRLKNAKKQESVFRCCGFYVTSVFTILSFIGLATLFGSDLFETGIQKIITLSENGSIYNLWLDPKLDILVQLHPFNYTNIEAVLAGKEKPKIKELGPYVFRQRITKANVEFHGRETLTYSENITNDFLSDLTNGNLEDDTIITPNVVIFAAIKQAREMNMLSQFTLSAVLSRLKTKPFIKISAREFLYGYDDDLSTILRKFVNFVDHESLPSFGFLASRDGLMSDRLTIGTGVPNLNNLGMIQEYDGNKDLENGYGEHCDNVSSSDGFLFPAELIETSETLHIYRKFVCRSIPMEFHKQIFTQQGFPAKRYLLPRNIFTSGDINPTNKCYCEESCLPSGVVSVAPCYYDAPLVLSQPHFLNGDQILLDNVIGLKPDAAKHTSYIDIHKVGVPIGGAARIQLNVLVKKSRYVSHLKGLTEGMVLPIGWANLQIANLSGMPEKLVYHVSFTAPLVKIGLQLTFSALFLMFLTRLFVYMFLRL